MRILIVSPISIFPSIIGETERILHLALGLQGFNNSEVVVLHAGRNRIPNLWSVSYFSFEYFLPNLKRGSLLDRILAPFNPFLFIKLLSCIKQFKPEILQFEFPIIPPFFRGFLKMLFKRRRPLMVLDSLNVDYVVYKNLASKIASLLSLYICWIEKINVKVCDVVLAVSYGDITGFTQIYGASEEKLHLIPNGVDLKGYENLDQQKARRILGMNENDKVVFFHGGLNIPNLEGALIIINQIVPKVKSRVKNVRFLIAGEICRYLKTNRQPLSEVELLGVVSNPKLFILAADVCLAPIFKGGGTSLKILEYLASGKPVITTPVGARGLNPANFPNLVICKTLEEMIDHLCYLIEEGRLKADFDKVKNNISEYDWRRISKKLNELYRNLATS